MANLFQPSLNRVIDSNGDPISGAKLYFYATGTNTPATVYVDQTGVTASTNPLVANAAGVFETHAYVDPDTTYRVKLTDADEVETIFDVDPVRGQDIGAVQTAATTVEESAATAVEASATAVAAKNDAVSAKDDVEAANIYRTGIATSDKAALDALTGPFSEGDSAAVYEDGTASNNGIYSYKSSAWVKVADLPDTAAAASAVAAAASEANVDALLTSSTEPYAFGDKAFVAGFRSSDDRVVMGIGQDGTAYGSGPYVNMNEGSDTPVASLIAAPSRVPLADMVTCFVFGQSNAAGSNDEIVTSATFDSDALMLGAVTPDANNRATSLSAMYEGAGGATSETIASGFAGQVLAMKNAIFPAFGSPTFQIAMVARGASGTAIANLQSDSGAYQNLEGDVAAIDALATGTNAVSAWLWLQGESDDTTAVATYKTSFDSLQADIGTDFGAITGQASAPLALGVQVFGGNAMQAHYELMKEGKLLLACPTYHVEYSDALHYSAHGMRRLGAYVAKAYVLRALLGIDWKPLYPTALTLVDASTIVLDLNLVNGAVVWDFSTGQSITDSNAAALENFTSVVNRFSVVHSDDVVRAIDRVEITGPAQVTIHGRNADFASGDIVRYGFRDYRTTTGGTLQSAAADMAFIRDDGQSPFSFFTDASGDQYDLRNALLCFQETLA